MNFNEYKSAEYWEAKRKQKACQITLQQLTMFVVVGALFYFSMRLVNF